MLSWIFIIVLREVSLNELLSEGSNSVRFCCMRWTNLQEKDTDDSHMSFCILCSWRRLGWGEEINDTEEWDDYKDEDQDEEKAKNPPTRHRSMSPNIHKKPLQQTSRQNNQTDGFVKFYIKRHIFGDSSCTIKEERDWWQWRLWREIRLGFLIYFLRLYFFSCGWNII